jgi:hypothetical protein
MTEPERKQVDDAVRKVRALRQVGLDTHISTTRAQSLVLRSLPDHLLVEASVELQNDRTGETSNATPAKK